MNKIEPNAAIRALADDEGYPPYTVVKVQPPDGMVIELTDGSTWNVSAWPGKPAQDAS